MPFPIQRVPRGLLELLSIKGGTTPTTLEDRISGGLELIQLYGLTQLTTNSAGGVRAEGASSDLILSATSWTVLFAASVQISRSATVTALIGTCYLQRGGVTAFSNVLWSTEFSVFGATSTGNCQVGGYLPYPLLCPPDTRVRGVADIIGTDANVTVTVTAEFGTLG